VKRGSKKPCPGCGEVKQGRQVADVCSDCGNLLGKSKWMEEQLSRVSDNEIVVSFGEQAHWNTGFYTRSHTGREILSILHHIVKSAAHPTLSQNPEFEMLGKIDYCGVSYGTMSKPLAEGLRDLYWTLNKAFKAEYEVGKKDGHNLLMRLADGDIGADEFYRITDKEGSSTTHR